MRLETQPAMTEISIDVESVPWSYRGSYMSFSTLTGELAKATPKIDITLVSQYLPCGAPCFVLRPVVEPLGSPSGFHTTPSPVKYRATPSKLEWVWGSEVVAEATYQNDRVIRLRGTKPMAFDTDQRQLRSFFFAVPKRTPESHDMIDWASMGLMPLRIIAKRGKLTSINAASELNGRFQIQENKEDEGWELFIHERSPGDGSRSQETASEWVARMSETPFEKCVTGMRTIFKEYAAGMCSNVGTVRPMDQHACYVMWTSTARADGFLKNETVLMSKLWMNKVWSWDNCFNALALAGHPGMLDSAINNFMEPFQNQLPDGRIPDAIMCNQFVWDYTKPPIQGWTLERLLAIRPEISDEQLANIYPGLHKFTDFWLIHRRVQGSELSYYSHGNDSGWDNSTSFDGDCVVINADLATHLILQTDMLARLSKRLGLGHEEYWTRHRERLVKALLDELWDGECFRVKRVATGATRRSSSLLQLVPLTASRFLPKSVVDKMVADIPKFLTPWGLASEPVDSPHYESDGYWRGPIWAPSTMIIESGIREAGHVALADDILHRFFALCEHGGFAENYDAVTGEGHRDLSHTWSSSIYLALRREAHLSEGSQA